MVCAILLLAGDACPRWGRPSALLPLGGDCLVNHVARAALEAGASPIVRVLGAHALAIAARPVPAGVLDVFNPDWARGRGTSIACGLRAALEAADTLAGVVILPCVPPLVSAGQLRECIEAVLTSPQRVVEAGAAEGGGGSAALGFGRGYFAELLALEGEADGRHIVHRHLRHRVVLPSPEERVSAADAFIDVVVRPDLPSARFAPESF